MEGKGRTDIVIKLLPVMDVGVSLHSKAYPRSIVMAQVHIVVSELVSCAFSTNPIHVCPFFEFLFVVLTHE